MAGSLEDSKIPRYTGKNTHRCSGVIFIDLAVFFIVGILIFSKLWNVLGTRPDGQKNAGTIFLDPKDVVIKKRKTPDPNAFYDGYDEPTFLDGAEAAFHMILKAYHNGDTKTLKNLVEADLLRSTFSEAVAEKPKEVCVLSLAITDKKKEKGQALISVRFTCQQVFEKQTIETEDIWTFKRSLKSQDPNWILSGVTTTN